MGPKHSVEEPCRHPEIIWKGPIMDQRCLPHCFAKDQKNLVKTYDGQYDPSMGGSIGSGMNFLCNFYSVNTAEISVSHDSSSVILIPLPEQEIDGSLNDVENLQQ